MNNNDTETMDTVEDETIDADADEISGNPQNHITSNSLLLLKQQAETTEKSKLSLNIIAAIELMALLRSCGASLNLYDKIVAWLEHCIPHNLKEPLPTREKVIKMMEKRHNLKCIAPIKTEVILPSINLPVEIPINPLLGCIYSLLSNDKLMTSDNLIFTNPNDPSQSTPYSGNYSEINTGLAYQSFQQSVQRIENAVPIPLFFFIDGTAIDHACRHSQTPVMMTLGIFKQSLRNKSVAWRNIGFVKNNVKEQYSQQQIDAATRQIRKYPKNHDCYIPDNHNDWHTQIGCIMNDLRRIQKKGIKWSFTIDGKKQTTVYRLIVRVLFFAGDTMEHNKLCSLRGGTMGKFPCHMCSITRNCLDSPNNVPISKLTNGNTI